MKLVSVAEMIAIEKEANAAGLTYDIMMENAGHGLADVILDVYEGDNSGSALGLVGSGNNGGDTLVALAQLAEHGWKVSAYIVLKRADDDPLVERFLSAGGKITTISEDPELEQFHRLLENHEVFLDGVLGTGIKLPLKPKLAKILKEIKSCINQMIDPPAVIAVDCPSGVDCDTGEAAPECIPADLTVTMAAIKAGLLKFPAYNLVGDLRLVGIGLPEDGESLESWRSVRCQVPDLGWLSTILPARPLDAHKGTFGTAMVIAGSLNYTGAALLAAEAAYRAGAGLVTIAAPTPIHTSLAGHIVEATWLLLPNELGVIAESAAGLVRENLDRVTAMLIGPGFGLEETTAGFLANLLSEDVHSGRQIGFVPKSSQHGVDAFADLPPIVIDADGLKLLVRIKDWHLILPGPAVLTPHPGEMSVLTGLSTENIQSDRIGTATHFSKEWGHVVVLKGAFTVIANPDGHTTVIPVASPALARAGSGDVLAGLIVGLLAQGVDAYTSAIAGAWIHAQAGLLAAGELGNSACVLAGDILRNCITVLRL